MLHDWCLKVAQMLRSIFCGVNKSIDRTDDTSVYDRFYLSYGPKNDVYGLNTVTVVFNPYTLLTANRMGDPNPLDVIIGFNTSARKPF